MWKNIAAQAENGEYGNPDKFCSDVNATNWMSATVATANEEIIRHIINVCHRDPREGKVTTRRHRHGQGQHRELVPFLDDQPSAAVQVAE